MTWHAAPDGRRFRTLTASCLCASMMKSCWQARCECGEALSKHDYTEGGAVRGALEVLGRADPRRGFGHARCP